MQILCTLDFRRGLSPPVGGRTFLVQACIHPYEVDEIEADWLAVLIHSPRDVDATALYVPRVGVSLVSPVGEVVDIAVAEAHEHIVPFAPAFINSLREVEHIVWQPCASEGKAIRQPFWIILLVVIETVDSVDNAAVTLIVCPGDIAHGIALVGHLVVIDHLADAVHIARATDLIPGVIGQAVAIRILRHHHDPRLVHTAKHLVGLFLISIAPDGKVALTRDIGDRVVEVEGDITAPASQGDEMSVLIVACYHFRTFPRHSGLIVARLVFRDVVDILPWGRTVFVDRLDKLRMFLHIVHALGGNGAK